MKINNLIIASILICVTSRAVNAQEVAFECDFENGIPETFTCFDRDRNEPSRSMKKYGFEAGVAWVAYTEDAGTSKANGVAYSGSWYKDSGTSDDWLVTPAITVTGKYGILTWRAHAIDFDYPDGYSVYITEGGNRPEDFTGEPLFSLKKESTAWTTHKLSLQAWEGKTIHIAFVNNSTNQKLLAIDDIKVFTPANTFTYISRTPESVSYPRDITLKGGITSSGFFPVEGYKVKCTFNGTTKTIDRPDEIIQPEDTSFFELPEIVFHPEDETPLNYEVEVTTKDEKAVLQRFVVCLRRTVLAEEGTGTWCQYCPLGQYGLQLLEEKYGELITDIAAHNGDEMQVTEYAAGLSPYLTQYPICVFNRKKAYIGEPYKTGDALMQKVLKEEPQARIEADAKIGDEGNTITISTRSKFLKDLIPGKYNLGFILAEDSVTGYEQANFYSGSSADYGGLEKLPDPIPAGEYFFKNVGRSVFPDFKGDKEAFNQATPRLTVIETERTYSLPGNITNFGKLKVVAIIIDTETNEIINAAPCTPDVPSSIGDGENTPEDFCRFYYNDDIIQIQTDEADNSPATVTLCTPDGKVILNQTIPTGQREITVSTSGYHGIVILKVTGNRRAITGKLLLH